MKIIDEKRIPNKNFEQMRRFKKMYGQSYEETMSFCYAILSSGRVQFSGHQQRSVFPALFKRHCKKEFCVPPASPEGSDIFIFNFLAEGLRSENRYGPVGSAVDTAVLYMIDCEVSDWVDKGECTVSCGGGQQLQTRSLLLLAERTVPASVRFVKKEELESRKVVEEGTAGSVDYEMEALDLGSDATGALLAA